MLQQRLATDVFGGALGKAWSKEENVPAWWKSQAKGADPTDITHYSYDDAVGW